MKIYSAFKLGLDASLIFFMQAVLLGKHDNKLEVATEYSRPPAVVFKTILSSVMCQHCHLQPETFVQNGVGGRGVGNFQAILGALSLYLFIRGVVAKIQNFSNFKFFSIRSEGVGVIKGPVSGFVGSMPLPTLDSRI